MKIRPLLLALTVSLLSGLSVPSFAEDTELFSGTSSVDPELTNPNVLFVLDLSGSMGSRDGGTTTRLERMQDALLQLLDEINNVNVGFMTFSGQPPKSGRADDAVVPVRFPITYIDEPLKNIPGEQGSSSSQSLSPISSSSNDAEEDVSTGTVVLENEILKATSNTGTNMTRGQTIVSRIIITNDSALERLNNGSVDTGTTSLYLGRRYSNSEQTLIGLRFPHVFVPKNATIKNAEIIFTSKEGYGESLSLLIEGVAANNPGRFNNYNKNISNNYPPTTATVTWEDIEPWVQNKTYNTPNLANIVQEIVNRSGWSSGNAMAFRLSRDPSDPSKSGRRKAWGGQTNQTRPGPLLRITYETTNGISAAGNFDQVTRITQKISSTNNDAYEFRGGGAGYYNMTPGTVVTNRYTRLGDHYCRNNYTRCRGKVLAGYRFTNLNIPKNAIITNAAIEFYRSSQNGDNEHDPLNLNIYVEDNSNASAFNGSGWNGSVTYDLSNRSRVAGSVPWNNVIDVPRKELFFSTNFASLVQKVVNRGDWDQNNNAIAVFFEPTSVNNSQRDGARNVYDFSESSSRGARLHLDWLIPQSGGEELVGLRFEDVQIPQGATVTKAEIKFTSGSDESSTANFLIHGEAHDNSPIFTATTNDISNRNKTSAAVQWNGVGAWTSNNVYSSPELKSIVQEIVNRSGWCGSNAMSFMISENGSNSLRRIKSYDASPDKAPVLYVEYDPNTVSKTACQKPVYSTQINSSKDDAEEFDPYYNHTNGSISLTSTTLELTTTGNSTTKIGRLVGFRFPSIPIKQGATIVKAELIFTARYSDSSTQDGTGAPLALNIKGELSPNAEVFNYDLHHLSSLPKTTNVVTWTPSTTGKPLTPWIKGMKYTTPDLKSIVQEIVNQSNWKSFNSLAFFVSGSGLRRVSSYDYDPSQAAILRIQVEGALEELTVRDRMKELVDSMVLDSYTPLADAIYEAGQYYMGGKVTHGADRKQLNSSNDNDIYKMRNNRISHVGSWEWNQVPAGTVQPPNCAKSSTNACATEHIVGNAKYIKPSNSLCNSNFIVFLTDGAATTNGSKALIKALPNIDLPNGDCMKRNYLNYSYSSKEKCGSDMVKYLYEIDLDTNLDGLQNVITHTIGFNIGSGSGKRYMVDWAKKGGGNFYDASSADDLLEAFRQIIGTVMRDNATITSPGISVNRFNNGYHSDKVYYSLFKPTSSLRWDGNIKKYRIEDMKLYDAAGNEAIEDGAIKDDARSYWSTVVDGKKVTKGGAGKQLMLDLVNVNKTRKVYTVCGGQMELVSGIACLGVLDEAKVKWLLGEDVNNQYNDASYIDTDGIKHRWAIADPLHSSPQAINYMPDNPDTENQDEEITKLFVGTNDGMVRMIDAKTGKENWAFVPNALINLPKTSKHTYGMDSTPIFWIKDQANDGINGSDFVRMFMGMRRGGRNLYALNVTDLEKPEQMWVIEGGTTVGFEKLAQTWSAPKPVLVNPKYCYDQANPPDPIPTECVVLIFGGGYDSNQDNAFGTSTIGNAIFMVKADTGDLLWSASNDGTTLGGSYLNLPDMNYPIPSDLKLVDTTGNGLIDRIYVGDLGSQVWRIDIDLRKIDEDSGKEVLDEDGSVIANFSDNDPNTVEDNRRFFYAPEHYYSSDVGDVLTIVSGRRTHPMSDNTVNDRFYTFIDKGWEWEDPEKTRRVYNNDVVLNETYLKDMTTAWITDDSNSSDYYNLKDDNNHNGWYINLSGYGEKGTSEPTFAYVNEQPVVFFTTFLPPGQQTNNVCEFQEGSSRLYALKLLTSGPGYDKKQDDNGNDIEEFASLSAGGGNHINDRSIILDTPGMASSVQIMNTEKDGAFAITGYHTVDVDDPGGIEQTYWRQVDE